MWLVDMHDASQHLSTCWNCQSIGSIQGLGVWARVPDFGPSAFGMLGSFFWLYSAAIEI